ncbi:terminase small subunit [Gordonia phage Diabla]|nr:terminase small subunit [Gordonia phage Diabla]
MPKLHQGRRYDLWWQNPFKYYEHLKDSGESQVLFDHSMLEKYKINPREFMLQHFRGMSWRCYVMNKDCVVLFDHTCGPRESLGSWPIWDYEKHDLAELKDLLETPWKDRPISEHADWYEVPSPHQPHRVFLKNAVTGLYDPIWRKRRLRLTKIQRLYPECEMFLKPKGFAVGLMFGSGFTACSVDPYEMRWLEKGKIILPNGRKVHLENVDKFAREIEHFGFDPYDVRYDQDVGLLYCIASIRYAAHHWDDPTGPFYNQKGVHMRAPDFNNPDMYAPMPSYEKVSIKLDKIKPTDKVLCDSCSLWRLCPAYRTEEVCGLPSSETRKLADMALSRNADDVVEMLASVVSKQAERVERKIDDEKFLESGYDKDVDKMLNNLFKNGATLAKLRNPNLGRPLVQINANVNPQAQAIEQADPRALAMGVIRELEESGVPREDITEEMIEKHLQANYAPKQLEGEVVDAEVTDG